MLESVSGIWLLTAPEGWPALICTFYRALRGPSCKLVAIISWLLRVVDGPRRRLSDRHRRFLGRDEGVALEGGLGYQFLLVVRGGVLSYGELDIRGGTVCTLLRQLLVEGLPLLLFLGRCAKRFSRERPVGLLDHRFQILCRVRFGIPATLGIPGWQVVTAGRTHREASF